MKTGRLNRKRCATLQNVISDLKRFHGLDSKNDKVPCKGEWHTTQSTVWNTYVFSLNYAFPTVFLVHTIEVDCNGEMEFYFITLIPKLHPTLLHP